MKRQTMVLAVLVSLCALGLSAAGVAQPSADRLHKDRLCITGCRQPGRVCRDAARTDAYLCAATECGDARTAARDACAADRTSPACADAREALFECLTPCRAGMREALRSCRDDVDSCVASCPDSPPLPPGPGSRQCLRDCRNGLHLCRRQARLQLQECHDLCTPLTDEARKACLDDPDSDACRTAHAAAHECLRPCRSTSGNVTANCLDTSRACIAECAKLSEGDN